MSTQHEMTDGGMDPSAYGVTSDYLRRVQISRVKKNGMDPDQVGAVLAAAADTVEHLLSDLESMAARRAVLERELLEVTGATAAAHMLASAERTSHEVMQAARREAAEIEQAGRARAAQLQADYETAAEQIKAEMAKLRGELEALQAVHSGRLAEQAADLAAARAETDAADARRRALAEAELVALEGRVAQRRDAIQHDVDAFKAEADVAAAALEARLEEFRAAARVEVARIVSVMGSSLRGLSDVVGFGSSGSSLPDDAQVFWGDADETEEAAQSLDGLSPEFVDGPWPAPTFDDVARSADADSPDSSR